MIGNPYTTSFAAALISLVSATPLRQLQVLYGMNNDTEYFVFPSDRTPAADTFEKARVLNLLTESKKYEKLSVGRSDLLAVDDNNDGPVKHVTILRVSDDTTVEYQADVDNDDDECFTNVTYTPKLGSHPDTRSVEQELNDLCVRGLDELKPIEVGGSRLRRKLRKKVVSPYRGVAAGGALQLLLNKRLTYSIDFDEKVDSTLKDAMGKSIMFMPICKALLTRITMNTSDGDMSFYIILHRSKRGQLEQRAICESKHLLKKGKIYPANIMSWDN